MEDVKHNDMQLDASKYYYVYITTDKNKLLLETNVTGALAVRIYHLEYKGNNFARAIGHNYTCIFLIYWEQFSDMKLALLREKEIKKWPKKKKIELVNSKNPQWEFLNEAVYAAAPLNTNGTEL